MMKYLLALILMFTGLQANAWNLTNGSVSVTNVRLMQVDGATLTGNNANGTALLTFTPSGGTPAGSTGQIQFNSSGSFGADSNLHWDNTNKRLGVGTAPGAKLDVNGDILLSSGTNSIRYVPGGGSFAQQLVIKANSGNHDGRLIIAPSGSNTTSNIVLQSNQSVDTIGSNYFGFGGGYAGAPASAWSFGSMVYAQPNTNSLPIAFAVSNTASGRIEAMRITATGNIGMGTTNPVYPLQIVRSSSGASLDLQASDNTTGATSGLTFITHTATADTNRKAAILFERTDSQGRGALRFLNNNVNSSANATVSDTRLIIMGDGNVGVGTGSDTPNRRLSVVGAVSSDTDLDIRKSSNTIGATTGITFSVIGAQPTGGRKAAIFFERTGTQGRGNLRFATNNVASTADGDNVSLSDTHMTITAEGNVGIGTDTPSGKLGVTGSASTPTVLVTQSSGTGIALDISKAGNNEGLRVTKTSGSGNAVTIAGGDLGTNSNINLSGETASTIAHFDASKNIKSLSTSTYPSLTELSYVKGVTSAIQTQLNAKAPINAPSFTGTVTSNGGVAFQKQAYFDEEVNAGNSSTAITINWTNGNKQRVTMTGNAVFTFTAPTGTTNILLRIIQDGTGGRTITWPSSTRWPGGTAPTLTAAANAIDIVSCYYNGTNYFCQAGLDFQAL